MFKRTLAPLLVGLFFACSGAQAARPNLPPPEYEEPNRVVTGATSLDAAAPAVDPGAPSNAPAPLP